jgi:hypothetical protein
MKKQKHKMSAVEQNISISFDGNGPFEFRQVNSRKLETFITFMQANEFFDDPTLQYDATSSLKKNILNLLILGNNNPLIKNVGFSWNCKVYHAWNDFIDGKYTIINKVELCKYCEKLQNEGSEFGNFIFNNKTYFVYLNSYAEIQEYPTMNEVDNICINGFNYPDDEKDFFSLTGNLKQLN